MQGMGPNFAPLILEIAYSETAKAKADENARGVQIKAHRILRHAVTIKMTRSAVRCPRIHVERRGLSVDEADMVRLLSVLLSLFMRFKLQFIGEFSVL